MQNQCRCMPVQVGDYALKVSVMCMLLIITRYDSRNCTKLVLKSVAAKNVLSISVLYCSFPLDYTISVNMMTTLNSCTLCHLFTE